MKLKKIIASLTAAAMAVTTMAFAPLSVSAEEDTLPLITWTLETSGKVADDEHYVVTLGDKASSVDRVKFTFSDVSTDYLQTYVIVDAGYMDGESWSSNYSQDLFVANISGETAVLDVQLGKSNNMNGDANSLSHYRENDTKKDMTIYPNWMNAGTASLKKIELYDSSNALIETIVGEPDVPKVTVTLYDGDPVDTSNWSNYVTISKDKFAPFSAGGKIIVTIKDTLKGAQYGTRYVTSEAWVNIVDYADITEGATSITCPISDELLGKLKQCDFVIGGHDYTIVKVEYNCPKSAYEPASIELDKSTLEIAKGEKATLTATVTPADSKITWESSDETVATVSDGVITAVGKGTATITAKISDTVFDECEVTVIYNTYAVTVKSNNDAYGTASANVKEAAENDTVELSYTAAKGYKFSKWESEDVTVAKDGTFTMPAKEVTVTAVFEELPPDEYAINITKPVNGKVIVKDGASSAVKNTVIDLVITPDKGYEVDTVKVNGEAVTGTSFTMPEKDVTIEVTFKKSTYTVTVAAAANGTVTADKATAQMGDTVTVTATPDTDYELSKITVNGTAITGNTFTMPAENVTIAAEFKKIGSADAEVVVPEGVSVSFAGSKEDILKAVFGDDYAALVEAGYKLDVVMTVKDETAVSAEDKALVEGALSDDMHIGLIIDVSLVMTKDGVSTVVENSSKPVSFVIGIDGIVADGRTYSVIRVHDGAAEDIGGTYDAANKTITVSSDKYSTYAVVYKDAPAPQPEPTVTYSITADRNVTLTASSAAAGTQINVRVDFGYDAYVYCGGRVIDKITEGGSFTMPAGNVTIVTKANGYLAMVKNAAPNSYIFVYDADMNYIKTNGSVKGIKGEGKITVKLGEEYAGKTVTLYKGRKSTSVKLESLTLDKNGNATFTVEGGKNYTAVVE